jgi:CBS-domain-containing membrane protein
MPGIDLSDDDVLEAMQRIPGYIDITTSDFRELYRHAHAHALERHFRGVRAGRLMRVGIEPLHPELRMDEAARRLAWQGLKSLPVVDAEERVVGVLTETDFLRRLNADTFLALLLRLMEDAGRFGHRCHETLVRAVMTTPAVTVPENAGFGEIVAAFATHEGRGMPVVGADGRLRGLLLRKDFLGACGGGLPG